MDELIYKETAKNALRDEFKRAPTNAIRAMKVIEALPSAQPEVRTEMSSADTVRRQEAIDAMANTLWHYPNECYRNLNSYEFAKALAELGLKSVPSAQPEQQIRCKDCAKREYCRTSTVWAIPPKDDWYCADAERRTDE